MAFVKIIPVYRKKLADQGLPPARLENCQNNDLLNKEIDRSGAPSNQTGKLSKQSLFKERN